MRTIRWTLLAVLVLVGIGWLVRQVRTGGVAKGSVLLFPLGGSYLEAPDAPLVAQLLGRRQRSFVATVSELRKAQRDRNLANVVLEIGGLEIGWAKAQELREVILSMREAGRHPIALLAVPGFGSNLDYYVASAAERVYLMPGAGPPLVGLASEYLFLGGLFDRIGVAVHVAQAGRYKGAAEVFSGRGMSEPFREEAESLLDGMNGQFVSGIAQARDLSEETVRHALDLASANPATLQELRLIDGERTRAELLESLGDPNVVKASDYASVAPSAVGFHPVASFALVYVSGAVVTGEGAVSRTGAPVASAESLTQALEQAAKDDSVRAIVLRVDSPGGGSFPAELIWRAVREARGKKPVVASFSDVAASAAYYIGSGADSVVAQPASLTGSIGVYALRPWPGPLFDRFDLRSEVLQRAPHAELNTLTSPLSPDTSEWLEAGVRATYDLFVQRVAEGRGLERSAVESVAEGRIWTGERAREVRLVDHLGGLRSAVDEAKSRTGIAADADVSLTVYPPPKPFAEQIAEAIRIAIVQAAVSALPFEITGSSLASERVAAWLAALGAEGALLVPPIWVEIR
jgi:protease-4